MTGWAGQHSHSAVQAKLRGVSIFIKTYSGGKKSFEFNTILNIIITYYQIINNIFIKPSHHQIFSSPAISM